MADNQIGNISLGMIRNCLELFKTKQKHLLMKLPCEPQDIEFTARALDIHDRIEEALIAVDKLIAVDNMEGKDFQEERFTDLHRLISVMLSRYHVMHNFYSQKDSRMLRMAWNYINSGLRLNDDYLKEHSISSSSGDQTGDNKSLQDQIIDAHMWVKIEHEKQQKYIEHLKAQGVDKEASVRGHGEESWKSYIEKEKKYEAFLQISVDNLSDCLKGALKRMESSVSSQNQKENEEKAYKERLKSVQISIRAEKKKRIRARESSLGTHEHRDENQAQFLEKIESKFLYPIEIINEKLAESKAKYKEECERLIEASRDRRGGILEAALFINSPAYEKERKAQERDEQIAKDAKLAKVLEEREWGKLMGPSQVQKEADIALNLALSRSRWEGFGSGAAGGETDPGLRPSLAMRRMEEERRARHLQAIEEKYLNLALEMSLQEEQQRARDLQVQKETDTGLKPALAMSPQEDFVPGAAGGDIADQSLVEEKFNKSTHDYLTKVQDSVDSEMKVQIQDHMKSVQKHAALEKRVRALEIELGEKGSNQVLTQEYDDSESFHEMIDQGRDIIKEIRKYQQGEEQRNDISTLVQEAYDKFSKYKRDLIMRSQEAIRCKEELEQKLKTIESDIIRPDPVSQQQSSGDHRGARPKTERVEYGGSRPKIARADLFSQQERIAPPIPEPGIDTSGNGKPVVPRRDGDASSNAKKLKESLWGGAQAQGSSLHQFKLRPVKQAPALTKNSEKNELEQVMDHQREKTDQTDQSILTAAAPHSAPSPNTRDVNPGVDTNATI